MDHLDATNGYKKFRLMLRVWTAQDVNLVKLVKILKGKEKTLNFSMNCLSDYFNNLQAFYRLRIRSKRSKIIFQNSQSLLEKRKLPHKVCLKAEKKTIKFTK